MNPNVNWPAASTVGQILSRAGLTNPKRKKPSPVRKYPLKSMHQSWLGAVTIIAAIRLPSPTRTADF